MNITNDTVAFTNVMFLFTVAHIAVAFALVLLALKKDKEKIKE